MTDNEIIKALECCTANNRCDTCPRLGMNCCMNLLIRNALDLINRQKAEIERLEKERASTAEYCLRKELKTELKTAQSEIIKEFAERLKETITNAINTYYNSNSGGYYLAEDVIEDIDDLVKEMTEVEQ